MPPTPRTSLGRRAVKQLISYRSGTAKECPLLIRAQVLPQARQCTPLRGNTLLSHAQIPRGFSTSSVLHKKKGKAEREAEESSSSSAQEVEDPFDFSTLEAGIEKVLDKLGKDLAKLRTGGRFNAETLENVRVHLVKDSKATERLGDLAQVLPKGGRSVMVLVGEKDHIKPIISAIQASKDLNLQPQPDALNPSQLNIPIPPPTKESRDLALNAASKAGENANTGVKNARAAMQKKLRGMEVKKVVRPDDLKKAHKEMEKIVEKGVGEVKKAVEVARKGMEQ